MTLQIPGWLLVLVLIVLVGALWFALMKAIISPAVKWLFGRIDRLMRRRLGITERKDDTSE